MMHGCTCFVILVCLAVASSLHHDHTSKRYVNDTTAEARRIITRNMHEPNFPFSKYVQTRGIGGVIAKIFFTSATVVNTGLTLAAALSGGCVYYQSICDDTDAIQELETEVNEKTKKFETMYYANQWRYLHLQEAMINNKYILFYINDTVRAVETQAEVVSQITKTIELNFQSMEALYSNSNSSSDALENLIGPFEYQYHNLQDMISALGKAQVTGVIVENVVQYFLSKAVSYCNDVIDAAKIKNGNIGKTDVLDLVTSNSISGDTPAQTSFLKKAKNYFEDNAKDLKFAFTAIGTDIKTKLGDIPSNSKRWWSTASSWPTIKNKFKSIDFDGKKLVTKVKTYFSSKAEDFKYKLHNYKYKKSEAFVDAIGFIIDVVQTIMDVNDWKGVRDQVADTRRQYQAYTTELSESIKELEHEEKELEKYWNEVISSFKISVQSFDNITSNVRKTSIFSNISGLAGLPVDTSDPFFSTDFDNVNETDLESKQRIVISFIKNNANSLTELTDKLRSQLILVQETENAVAKETDIESILRDLKRIYVYSPSTILNDFGTQLDDKEVVCTVAITSSNLTEYDSYPLPDFRVKQCNISYTEFTEMKEASLKNKDSKILYDTVTDRVSKQETVTDIKKFAQYIYSNQDDKRLKAFGLTITAKDVVCAISTLFPDLDEYNWYPLTDFRPDCYKVTDDEFAIMEENTVKIADALNTIKFLILRCEMTQKTIYCLCLSDMAEEVELSEDITLKLLNQLKPRDSCEYKEVNGLCQWDCS